MNMTTQVKKSNRRKKKLNTDETSTITPVKKSKTNMITKTIQTLLYDLPSKVLAQNLLGKVLVRKVDETICKGRIVETECYPGGEDKASCTFNGKRSPATEALYMDAGTAFVYMTYGMYYCINISSSEPGGGVLIRALEPLEGIEDMRKWRIDKTKSKKDIKTKDLCNGPSKLCTSLQITKKDCNMMDLKTSESMWIEDDPKFLVDEIVCTSRIGIAAAGKEWGEKPYRFYIFGNDYVSKRDLKKEEEIAEQKVT